MSIKFSIIDAVPDEHKPKTTQKIGANKFNLDGLAIGQAIRFERGSFLNLKSLKTAIYLQARGIRPKNFKFTSWNGGEVIYFERVADLTPDEMAKRAARVNKMLATREKPKLSIAAE